MAKSARTGLSRYHLQNPARISPTFAFTGPSTSPGSSQWTGTYLVTKSDDGKCGPAAGEFVATTISPVNGTYAGNLKQQDGSVVAVSLRVAAEAFATELKPWVQPVSSSVRYGHPVHCIPLTGTIRVSGLAALPDREIPILGECVSRLEGDGFIVVASLENGSGIILSGGATVSGGARLYINFEARDANRNSIAHGGISMTRQ